MEELPDEVSRVIVSRLLRYYDPFGALALNRGRVARRVLSARPREHLDLHCRTAAYHVGRIRWLMEHVSEWKHTPISVDNFCDHGHFGPPIVVDGHHRLCAAALLKRRYILATYSGLVSTLDYLTGVSRRAPEF